jgi:exopolyphosphatase / guanosine-5'-triphosphate,3'-diphosphate pyrophosphatase
MSDPRSPIPELPSRRICAIDLGTNSFHAVIVDIYPDRSYRTIDSLKEMVVLGSDVANHRLSPESMQRGIDALRKIRTLSDSNEVDEVIAYATSAIRESENGGDFIQRAIDETGIKVQAIPGIREAELIGFAVQHGMYLNNEPVLVMDIGGGSVEYIITNRDHFYYLDSRKIGVSRMSSRFVRGDVVTKTEIAALKEHYAEHLKDLNLAMKRYPVQTLIGSSGTMQNLAQMIAARKKKDVSLTLNEFEYTAEDFKEFYNYFIKLSRKERLEVTGLDEKRIDFIVPGLVLVDLVIDEFEIKSIRTSTDALREGIIISYMRKEMKSLKMSGEFPDPRRRSVYELLRKCNWHEKHSTHVAKLALQMYDALQNWHDLTERERELLEYACLMHDIGYHISHHRHHKHALYLILNADLKGFTQDEIEIMAHVARYHRRSTPKKRHQLYATLSDYQKDRVKKLAGILRVADGLDRSHFQNVIKIDIEVGDKIVFKIKTSDNPELEIWGAMRKRELLESMFNKPLEIVV